MPRPGGRGRLRGVGSRSGQHWGTLDEIPSGRALARRLAAPLVLAAVVAALGTFAGALGGRLIVAGRAVASRPLPPRVVWLVVRPDEVAAARQFIAARPGLDLVKLTSAAAVLGLNEATASHDAVLEVALGQGVDEAVLARNTVPGLVEVIPAGEPAEDPVVRAARAGRWLISGAVLWLASWLACLAAGLASGRVIAVEIAADSERERLLPRASGRDSTVVAGRLLGAAMAGGSLLASLGTLLLAGAAPVVPELDPAVLETAWMGSSLGFALSAWVVAQAGVKRARVRRRPGLALAFLLVSALPLRALPAQAAAGPLAPSREVRGFARLAGTPVATSHLSPRAEVRRLGRAIAVQAHTLQAVSGRRDRLERVALRAAARGARPDAVLARGLWRDAARQVASAQARREALVKDRQEARRELAAWRHERAGPHQRMAPFAAARRVAGPGSPSPLAGSLALRDERGRSARAVADGRVAFVGVIPGWGRVVVLDHGYRTHSVYGGMAALVVEPGERVAAGGIVGSGAGPGGRILFGIRRRGRPVDPAAWWRRG